MLIILAVAEPDTKVVACSNLNHVRIALSRLGMEVFQKLLVCDISRKDSNQYCFTFYASKDFILAFNDPICLILVSNQFSHAIYGLA